MLNKRFVLCVSLILVFTLPQTSALAWENSNFSVANFGGSGNDVPNSIVIDSLGNSYIGGYFAGTTDFNPSSATDTATSISGYADAFIAKYTSTGSLVWAKSFGGLADDQVIATALDSGNNLYITGTFNGSVDFDYTQNVESITAGGSGTDIFISKISPSGDRLWTKTLGGSGVNDTPYAIAVDSAGNVIVGGEFRGSVDFDPGLASTTINNATGYTDLFVLKLNTDGDFVWVRSVTNTQSNDQVLGVSIFPNGDVVAVGGFGANSIPADFDPGVGTFTMAAGSTNHNIFIWKLASDGSFGWARNVGNSATADRAYAVAIDSYSNVYTTGAFQSAASFSSTGDTLTATSYDAFVTKHDSSGSFQWAKQIAGSGAEYGRSISIDSSSNVFVSGHFTLSVDLDPSSSEFLANSAGNRDFFVTKLNTSGDFQWGKTIGSTGDDVFVSSRLDQTGNFLATGYIAVSFTLNSGSNSMSVSVVGAVDAFYLCLTTSGNFNCGASRSDPATSSEEEQRKVREERERAISRARNQALDLVKSGKALTNEIVVLAADSLRITDKQIPLLNADLMKLSETSKLELNSFMQLMRKYDVLTRIEARSRIYFSELMDVGLVIEKSPYRTMIMIKLRKLPKESIDSEVELKAALAAFEQTYIDRNKRLKETIERINSRSK